MIFAAKYVHLVVEEHGAERNQGANRSIRPRFATRERRSKHEPLFRLQVKYVHMLGADE